ncbi:AraC family transcriptional regulator [Nocardioides marmorisolisilvae]|uniref:AraC family transcriptional regulator n=1 Tax=Nocardioides marmorisolisilvae TaxID=1542737 RepID=A0A3N0DTJ6_9ACTN|nr:AraC family transcriptional regulator [Nocardioides marmorisolisilvae]RNL78841.1 AraC family transcriptional regulator [Nocardioides marmorisolisilvae]
MTPTLPEPVTRDWDFARGVGGIAVLVEYAGERGLAATAVLAGTGLSVADLRDLDREVTAAQELRVVRNLIGAGHADGIAVGRRYHLSAFGIFGYALLSSRTVLDAITVALRFLDLTYIFVIPQVRLEGDQVLVELDAETLPADVREFLVERDLAAIETMMAETVAGPLPTVLSVQRRTLAFPAELLERPLPQANPTTQALCEQLCADLASRRRDGSGLAQQVRVLIAQRLAFDPSLGGVAAGLGLSDRTLRRRLAADGTSFQVLLDQVRSALAGQLLGSGALSVEEVAHRLGYAEASSFIAAHRRWHGSTPTGRVRA